jgi:hypothetical protein
MGPCHHLPVPSPIGDASPWTEHAMPRGAVDTSVCAKLSPRSAPKHPLPFAVLGASRCIRRPGPQDHCRGR